MSENILEYVFEITFKDGSHYLQNADDTPQNGIIGSAFTDVKDRLEEMADFRLLNLNGGLIVLVNLEDGHFEVNGVRIEVQDPRVRRALNTNYRLIYFRRVQHSTSNDGSIWKHPVQYHVGWQCLVDGSNVQQTISIT